MVMDTPLMRARDSFASTYLAQEGVWTVGIGRGRESKPVIDVGGSKDALGIVPNEYEGFKVRKRVLHSPPEIVAGTQQPGR